MAMMRTQERERRESRRRVDKETVQSDGDCETC
jgi:hypothetical protein